MKYHCALPRMTHIRKTVQGKQMEKLIGIEKWYNRFGWQFSSVLSTLKSMSVVFNQKERRKQYSSIKTAMRMIT